MKSVWDDRIRQVEAELVQLREHLVPLESGKVKLSSRTDNGPWEDVTQPTIERNKQVIRTYEAILADMKKRSLRL